MPPAQALSPEDLYKACDPDRLGFASTDELAPLDRPLGQERAVAALDLGIALKRPGYNMFVLGTPGSARLDLVLDVLKERARGQEAPADWCYVQNFKDPSRPRALQLPQGRASSLRDAVKRLVDDLRIVLPASFATEEYRNRRQIVDEHLKERHETAFGGLDRKARAQGIALVRTPMGFALAPVREGTVMKAEDFAKLPEAEQDRINKLLQSFQEELEATMRQVPHWQREHAEEVRQLNREVTRLTVTSLTEGLRRAHEDLPQVTGHIGEVENDIVEHADELFLKQREEDEPGPPPSVDEIPGLRRYRVNVMVGRAPGDGAPVQQEDNPTHHNLVGRVEHYARFGTLFTDFNLLKPGALHRANGGYLVLDARKVLTTGFAWDSLKRALRTGEIRIESIEQLLSLTTTTTLDPEPIPLDVKVVLVGDRILYYLLCELDPEFADLFKVEADLEDDVPRSDEGTALYARLVARQVRALALKPLDRAAVALVVEQAARAAGDGTRLSADLRWLGDLLAEADHLRARDGAGTTGAAHVRAAIAAKRRRASRIYERITHEIAQGTILIDVAGSTIGQVNGLAVTALGDFAFGRPSRITAAVRAGRGTVVDIERAAKLGGATHSKGVMILAGYLGATYLPDKPLSLAASLGFEQSYGMIDGDSASSAELYALLSAIAEVPLRQDLAVTGSVNQKGEVQAIGGANEKIEGFFDACSAKGLTGSQGVVIPRANVRHLMLRDDVVAAARAGRFRVHAVATIDEGLALLTGLPTGTRQADGRFPEGTVNARVEARLRGFAAAMAAAGQDAGKASHG